MKLYCLLLLVLSADRLPLVFDFPLRTITKHKLIGIALKSPYLVKLVFQFILSSRFDFYFKLLRLELLKAL